jgi:Na+-driven multidrug efflux pump
MLKNIIKIAFPAIISMFFVMVTEIINTVYVGHLNDPVKLAGVGMGNMTMNILGLSFVLGLNGALETFVAQAHGTGNYYMCGVFLNRGRFIVICAFIPIVILLL